MSPSARERRIALQKSDQQQQQSNYSVETTRCEVHTHFFLVLNPNGSECFKGSSAASGVGILDECLRAYDEVKMGHRWLYIIFRVSEDLKICVDEKGGHDKTYNDFVEKLKEAEKKKQCRYAIFDVHFMQNDIPQEKIAFFLWSPDSASLRQKMLYASSKQALRNNMRGIQAEIQCNDDTDLAMSNILQRIMRKYT